MDMEVIIRDSVTTSLQNKSPYCVNVFHSWRPFRWCWSCVGCSDLWSCLGLHNLLRMLFFNPLTFLSHLKFFRSHHLLKQCSALLCIIMDKHLQRRVFFPHSLKEMGCFSSPPLHLNQCIKVGEEKSLWVFKRHLGKILNFQSLCYWNKFLIVRNHTSTITNESKLAHCEGDCTFAEPIPELCGCA